MADVLTHNIDQIVNRLTAFQRTALPKAARRTVSQLGFDLARKDLPQYMSAVFDNPVPFTLNSLKHPTGYKVVSNYEVQLNFRQNVSKGNDPARYLEPVAKTGGAGKKPVYQTKFTRYLHAAGIAPRNFHPVPFKANLSKNSYGNVSQGEYSKVWRGLQTTKGAGKTGRGFRYFSKPTTATAHSFALAKEACSICRMASIASGRGASGAAAVHLRQAAAKGLADLRLQRLC